MNSYLLGLFGMVHALAAGAEPMTELTFRTLSVTGKIDGIYYSDAKGVPVELRSVDYVRSTFYQAYQEQPLLIYRFLAAREGENELQKEVLGRVEWPEVQGPFLLLVGKRGGTYSFSLAPDDTESFPMGSFRIYNASELQVVIQVGDVMAQLVPGESKVLFPDPDQEGRGSLFQVAAKVGDEPRVVYSNLWNGSKTQRTLVFILNRNNPRSPIGLKRLHESELVLRRKNELAP